MASQYSILRNYGKYVSPYNMDVMMQGMGYMQQEIDTNRQAGVSMMAGFLACSLVNGKITFA